MKLSHVALYASSIFAFATAIADKDDLSSCTVCHGAQGNGNYAIRAPKIAGMEPWYLRRQFEAFRLKLRGTHPDDAPGNEMQPVGARLHLDGDIDRVVAYVASFKPKAPPLTIEGDVQLGRRIYESCTPCHGSRGEGNEIAGAPALASRSDWYLIAQLDNFSSGRRGADPRDTYGAQMRAAVAPLRDTDSFKNVVAYINTLR